MISSLYAALLALVFIFLTIKVIKIRRREKVAVGDNGNLALQKAIAAQANFCQSTPIFLILLTLAEISGLNNFILHFCAIIFLCGRIIHAYGISQTKENFHFRVTGMVATFSSIIILSLTNLISYFLAF